MEAARGESLWRLVGGNGFVYGMGGFGVSAPQADLAEHFGFTPARLAARVLEHVRDASG